MHVYEVFKYMIKKGYCSICYACVNIFKGIAYGCNISAYEVSPKATCKVNNQWKAVNQQWTF